MEKTKNFNILDGFILKILAIIFMTFDHIGVFLSGYGNLEEIASIFRLIGRFSFPLIIFLLVEGIIHTKNIKLYFLRLSLLAFVFMVGQIGFYIYDKGTAIHFYSPAVDLLLTATTVYLLKRKDKLSYLAILPFLWSIGCLIVRYYEALNTINIKWIPFVLRPDYLIIGPVLGVAFYYAHDLTKLFFNSREDTKNFLGTTYEQVTYNVISSILLIILILLITFVDSMTIKVITDIPWEVYSLFAFIPILFYSGKRGYNAKWFRYGCYIYFPTHLVLLFIIFLLI
jgi:hypothetical protein